MCRNRIRQFLSAVIGLVLGAHVLSLPASGSNVEGALDLQYLLKRTSEYVDRFHEEFSNCVLEEKYVQKSRKMSITLRPVLEIRILRSDVLLLWVPESKEWALFRDVYEVDGQQVRERDQRLQKLFIESPARLEEITSESARYNLGPVRRNINVPTLVLTFLRAENLPRFQFKISGKDKVEGLIHVKVDFTEHQRPTLISNKGKDTFCQGSVWVDPVSGMIRRTRLVVSGSGTEEPKADIQVTFKQLAAEGIALPAFMTESYTFPHSSSGVLAPEVHGRADYTNIRQFRIQTDENVTPQSSENK